MICPDSECDSDIRIRLKQCGQVATNSCAVDLVDLEDTEVGTVGANRA
jgi:hypothetical protein